MAGGSDGLFEGGRHPRVLSSYFRSCVCAEGSRVRHFTGVGGAASPLQRRWQSAGVRGSSKTSAAAMPAGGWGGSALT